MRFLVIPNEEDAAVKQMTCISRIGWDGDQKTQPIRTIAPPI
jgi:hypothetical protein